MSTNTNKLESITDQQAIHIAHLALDDEMRNPVVHSFIDDGVRFLKVIDEYPDPLMHIDDLENSLYDWVEIDEDLTVRERHNTLCNMVEIYNYLREIGILTEDEPKKYFIYIDVFGSKAIGTIGGKYAASLVNATFDTYKEAVSHATGNNYGLAKKQ